VHPAGLILVVLGVGVIALGRRFLDVEMWMWGARKSEDGEPSRAWKARLLFTYLAGLLIILIGIITLFATPGR
jgi:hypothetical protein